MRKIRTRPCAICGNDKISDYIVNRDFSYRSCDRCNIHGPAAPTTFQSTRLWNKIMKGETNG